MKFIWNKKGRVFNAEILSSDWASHSAMTPTPIYLNKDVIRVYVGFRDISGVSRIGYVDLGTSDPKRVIGVSEVPCIDIGIDGCFDDNGVILGDVIRYGDKLRMYYVGFQLVKKAKFLAFSGIAESKSGEVFKRLQDYPVLDRGIEASTINAIHSVLRLDGSEDYLLWHARGSGWEIINDVPYPRYNIWVSKSQDGVTISEAAALCVDNQGDEYRIGRPSVFKYKEILIMFYTKGTTSGADYYPGVALSKDGFNWERKDDLFNLPLSASGWDSKHIAYPRALKKSENTFHVFYNGNDMGKTGFGYAELTIED